MNVKVGRSPVDALQETRVNLSRGSWVVWSCFLVVIYLVTSVIGWVRTLDHNEVWALYYASQPIREQLRAIRSDLVHPPLMYFVQRLWLAAFGQSDLSAKSLVLAINIPTIVLFT